MLFRSDALMFVQTGGKYGQGSSYYAAKNPEFGATFSWWLKEVPKTLREKRREAEKKLFKDGERIPQLTEADIRAEEQEIKPYLVFTVKDSKGEVIRRLYNKPSKGLNRINWDLRYAGTYPVRDKDGKFDPFSDGNSGMFVLPGEYSVSLAMVAEGETRELAEPVTFTARVLDNTTLPAPDREALVSFQNEVADLARIVMGTNRFADELSKKLTTMQQAVHQTPSAPAELGNKILALSLQMDDILWTLNGKKPVASREENPPAPVSINERLGNLIYAFYRSTSAPTSTQKRNYQIIREEFPEVHSQLKQISEVTVPAIEAEMEAAGVPYTSGRLPEWR